MALLGITKPENERQRLELLRSQLLNERSSFLAHWKELGSYIAPRRPRFDITDVNRGDRRNQNIIDATATLAARTLRSGLMSGVTSPARPWFRLSTPDPDLAKFGSVKDWLYIVSQRMADVFLRSNLYNSLPILYGDIGVFATAAMMIEEDFEHAIITHPFPIGSYTIANSARLKVEVFVREFRMTVRQLVEKFGDSDGYGTADWSNFSPYIKNQWDIGNYETWVDVVHVIRPNPDFNPKMLHSKYKRFKSTYYERGMQSGGGSLDPASPLLLSEMGYDYFPVLCPRWEVTGEDVYGTDCPGMSALGDIKQLQLGEKRGAQALEKMINPPMVGPTSMKNQKSSILPGDINYLDVREGMQGFKAAHEISFSLDQLENKQEAVRNRVKRAFFEDLFLMLSESDRRQITAREVDERHEEKLLALGPVLEQLNQDLLDPLIHLTFQIMMKQGLIPPPPPELQQAGMQLKIEYISIMAQAQKLQGIAAIERFSTFVGQVAQQTQDPSVMDNVDVDQLVEVYGDMTSVPPGIVRAEDEKNQIRAQRQQQQAQQQKLQSMQQGAQTAQTLSQTDTSGQNALTQLLDQSKAGQLAPQ